MVLQMPVIRVVRQLARGPRSKPALVGPDRLALGYFTRGLHLLRRAPGAWRVFLKVTFMQVVAGVASVAVVAGCLFF